MQTNRLILLGLVTILALSVIPASVSAGYGFDDVDPFPAKYIWWDSLEPRSPHADYTDLSETDPTVHNHSDMFCPSQRTDLGFPFKFYGRAATRVNVMAGGFLSFDPSPCITQAQYVESPLGCRANPSAYSYCYWYGTTNYCSPDAVTCSSYGANTLGYQYTYHYESPGYTYDYQYCYAGYQFLPSTPVASGFNAIVVGMGGQLLPTSPQCAYHYNYSSGTYTYSYDEPVSGKVLSRTTGPIGDRVFTVQYQDVDYMYRGTYYPKQSFQIQLFEKDNHIEVNLRNVQSTWYPLTSGIENLQGSQGLRYALLNYAGITGRTVWYYPVPSVTVQSDPERPCVSDSAGYSLEVLGADPLGGVASIDWDWGDGSPHSDGLAPSHTYLRRDTYSAQIRLTFGNGYGIVTDVPLRAYGCVPPVAAFDVHTGQQADMTVNDQSTDADGTIVAWDWDWGDGTPHATTQDPGTHAYYDNLGVPYRVSLTVTDDEGFTNTAVRAVTIHGYPAYIGPEPRADAGPDRTVREGMTVTLDGSGGDQAHAARTTWTQVGGAPVALTNPGSAHPSFTAPATVDGVPMRLTFALVLYDGHFTSKPSVVNITVNPANMAPVAKAGPTQAQAQAQLVTLDASASSDPDNDPLTYRWTQVAGPAVTLSDATAMRPTFTAPAVTQAGASIAFKLTASDGAHDSTDYTEVRVFQPVAAEALQAFKVTPLGHVSAGMVRLEAVADVSPGATQFLWEFADGVQAGASIEHQFATSGEQHFTLHALDAAGQPVGDYPGMVNVYVPSAPALPAQAHGAPALGLLGGLLALALVAFLSRRK